MQNEVAKFSVAAVGCQMTDTTLTFQLSSRFLPSRVTRAMQETMDGFPIIVSLPESRKFIMFVAFPEDLNISNEKTSLFIHMGVDIVLYA